MVGGGDGFYLDDYYCDWYVVYWLGGVGVGWWCGYGGGVCGGFG